MKSVSGTRWRRRSVVPGLIRLAVPTVLVGATFGATATVALVANAAPAGAATAAPVNTALPVITDLNGNAYGYPALGDTFQASTGTWTGSPASYAYQWYTGTGFKLTGQTDQDFTTSASTPALGYSDRGYAFTVVVTATNPNGSTSATAAKTNYVRLLINGQQPGDVVSTGPASTPLYNSIEGIDANSRPIPENCTTGTTTSPPPGDPVPFCNPGQYTRYFTIDSQTGPSTTGYDTVTVTDTYPGSTSLTFISGDGTFGQSAHPAYWGTSVLYYLWYAYVGTDPKATTPPGYSGRTVIGVTCQYEVPCTVQILTAPYYEGSPITPPDVPQYIDPLFYMIMNTGRRVTGAGMFENTVGSNYASAPPTAAFTSTQTSTNAFTYAFNANGSHAASGHSLTTYTWTFGDGHTGSGLSLSHTYASGGTYTVKLTVKDDSGATTSVTHSVRIAVLVVNSSGDSPEVTPATSSCNTGHLAQNGTPECTLRAAIAVANADGGDTIQFAIPGTAVLRPASPYPPITSPDTINGTSQSGGWVTLKWTTSVTAPSNAELLSLKGGGIAMKGLSIVGFPSIGLFITGGTGDTVSGDRIGVGPTGTVAEPAIAAQLSGTTNLTFNNDVLDGSAASIYDLTGAVPGLKITNDRIGTTPNGTALARPATNHIGQCGICLGAATGSAASASVAITGNIVAGFDDQLLVGGAGLTTLSVSDNHVGVDDSGATLTWTNGLGPMTYGIRLDDVPAPIVSGNDIGGNRRDLTLSGALNWGISTYIYVFDPGNDTVSTSPAAGSAAIVTNNVIGVGSDGVTASSTGAQVGLTLFGGETGATITGNTVAGHRTTEVLVTGGGADIVSGNHIGVGAGGQAVTQAAVQGLVLKGVSNATVGGTSHNVVGGIAAGPGLVLTNTTGTTVSNNLIGIATDGTSGRPDQVGIKLSGTDTGSQVGPGNVVSGNTAIGIESGSAGVSISGNDIGTNSGGSAAVSNGTGIVLDPTATGTKISNNVIDGTPSTGTSQLTVNGSVVASNLEIGVLAQAGNVEIANNRIGVAAVGTAAIGNSDGVVTDGAGPFNVHDNTIANSSVAGVYDSKGQTTLRSNSIYANATGITGPAKSTPPRLVVADRVTTKGVTRTWLAVSGLPTSGTGTIEAFGNATCSDPEGKYPLKLQKPMAGTTIQVITVVGNTSLQGFTVTYTPAGPTGAPTGSTSAFSACQTANTTASDANGDGIPDQIEGLGPYKDAGATQSDYANVPTDTGGWVGLHVNSAGGQLTGVAPATVPGGAPAGLSLPSGLVDFTITGLQPGATAVVTFVYTPAGPASATYWRYGPTTSGGPSIWYQWNFSKTTGTGAESKIVTVDGTSYTGFVLNFTDGGRGDDDLTANGTIVDPGGPGVLASTNAPSPTPSGGATSQTSAGGPGYREVAADGGVFAFGDANFYGSEGGTHLNQPIVGIASTRDGGGYWEVAADGGVFAFGDANFYGSEAGTHLNQPIVGIASTHDGGGYWEVAADGGVFAFGDANFYGSEGGTHLNQPIVGIASTHDGGGYWEVAADGGVFAFGDANFYGSEGGTHLNQPIVGIASTRDGGGYWEVAADGGVFAFGDANFYGSEGGTHLNQPIVGIASTHDGGGYWEVAADGGVFAFGDANFYGSEGGTHLNQPIVGIA